MDVTAERHSPVAFCQNHWHFVRAPAEPRPSWHTTQFTATHYFAALAFSTILGECRGERHRVGVGPVFPRAPAGGEWSRLGLPNRHYVFPFLFCAGLVAFPSLSRGSTCDEMVRQMVRKVALLAKLTKIQKVPLTPVHQKLLKRQASSPYGHGSAEIA